MIPLPYIEDIFVIYFRYIKETLYPPINNNINKWLAYIISTLHLLGTLQIMFGIFLPPDLLILNFIYLLIIYLAYFIFNNHCFMTLLTNKISGITRTPLYIKFTTAKIFLTVNLVITVIGLIKPEFSLYNLS